MNRRRELLAKVVLLLETSEADLLESFLELLYRRTIITAPSCAADQQSCSSQAQELHLLG